ncbi:MAG: SDR family NAD(P)-dependent oxidoreductase [Planctomycetes bacterium]|nr:SDR family NAD(P)-dependent oxidoreductase [Planctomycetota bacterium]
MSDLAQRLASLSPAQRQLLEQRLTQARPPAAEPIAIVGMACRFPGAPDLGAYWQLIHDAASAVSEVPPDRWNADEFYDPSGEAPGKMSVRWAALIENPDQFDPQFFGITPREAARMDPQQRLLLEVAWEAMENAGLPADQLAGTRTGVFVGIGGTDYTKVSIPYDDYYRKIDAHLGTGNALSIAANRLSYIFDFHGPSAAVDTACSSSSLAIHFAVESLRRGESDAALAGGVNMILTPETTIAFSKARMLSASGKCRPFDASADGYVRGEGCGLVLLKRLADARRDGDTILAVLRATSVNQDGRTSGISAPNSQSQTACIRAALKQAGISADDVSYVEAHGTGTSLGDPIEMQALTEIFAAHPEHVDESLRDSKMAVSERLPHMRPCYVSSVKANVGHMETVSGVASLIKVVLMMQHDEIAPQANFETLNPHINLASTRVTIPTKHITWPRGNGVRTAGVSSFGFGGTNTHLIVESPTETAAASAAPSSSDRPLYLLKLSAKSEAALAQQAEQLANDLELRHELDVADVCWSANTGRSDFNYRAAVAANDAAQLQQRLRSLTGEKADAAGVKRGTVRALGRPTVAMLFTGQGAQYVGMGRGLYDTQPVFRRALDECDAILKEMWDGESLLEILFAAERAQTSKDTNSRLNQTRYTQPALFALEYALAQLWASWGVVPDIVLGHSVGEYAAACVAGVMSLRDGLALIAERARLMQNVRRHGKMTVIFASPDRVANAIKSAGGNVVIAVINGPENTVLSGDAASVDGLSASFEAAGIQVRPLNVSHAFHSPLMDEMLNEFEAFASRINFQKPRLPFAANLTGQLMTEAPTARYWRDHLRNTVQFAEGMNRIAEARPTMIIEIGPSASLLGMGRRCLPKLDAAWLPSLREGQDDWPVLAASVSEYYVRGGQVDWRGWDKPWQRKRLLLPTYPFQRSRHWFNLDPALRRAYGGDVESNAAVSAPAGKGSHPLLGTQLSTVWTNALFEARLSARSPAYLADHRVQGSPVTPAAAYVEQALAAAEQLFGPGRHGVANLVIQQAMFLPAGTRQPVSPGAGSPSGGARARRRVQISVAPESGGESSFEIYSRPEDHEQTSDTWAMHASGSLLHESRAASTSSSALLEHVDLEAARDRAVGITSREDFYQLIAERGLVYGPAFQVLSDLHRGVDDAVARVELPESVIREAGRYRLHPALGDALLQMMAGAVPLEDDGSFSPFTYMPVGIRNVHVRAAIEDFSRTLFAYAIRTSSESGPSPERVEANVYLVDESGNVCVALEGVQVQRLGRNGGDDASHDTSRWVYRVVWEESQLNPAPVTPPKGAAAWLIFADRRGVATSLAERLVQRGEPCVLVTPGNVPDLQGTTSTNGHPAQNATASIDPLDEEQYRKLIDAEFTAKKRACLGVVHLWSLDISTAAEPSPGPSLGGRGTLAARELGCGGALQLVRALSRAALPKSPLWFITAGAQAVAGADNYPPSAIAIEQSPLLGFGRVAAMELPDLRPRLVDLDPLKLQRAADQATTLAYELAANSDDGEIAYRGGKRFVARLVPDPSIVTNAAANDSTTLSVPRGPFQLRITQVGSFDTLAFVPVEREPPAAGQVEIEVHAAGLNFSDVLKALGLYPGIKDAIVPLGIEASGVVTAVGEDVKRFRVGDEVFGVVPYAFASHARTAEYALVHKPKSIDHDQACTIPITFLTAYYGLVRLAQLQPGERVLIHAGAGGVGLAAIQIVQKIGAEIFATAGSDAKRDILRSLGVRHVFSSRSTAFADEILAATDRQGVDVVLNSLPGEAIAKSLSILRAYGRFLEIGKTDIYQNRMIGLLPFQDNLSYFAIDLDRMLRQRPEYIQVLFADVMRHFEAGEYEPLNFTRFETEGTIDAFRYMSQRKNVGKVVVAIADCGTQRVPGIADSESQSEIRNPKSEISTIRRDGAYLITGGLGALGLRVARWLAVQGAGTIALLSRRGPSEDTEAALNSIRGLGARVVVLSGDVADAESLGAALAQLPHDAPPLRGVVHAAGVLADGVLVDMSLDQLDRPMAPKVAGAWNLHTATLKQPLDFFVLFSSVASVLGSPGQANYAAGNAYLDALAHARRASGLPATAINWGPWAGSGMAAEAGRSDAVKSRGMALIEPEYGLALMEKILRTDVAQVTVMDARWDDMLRLLGSRRPALLDRIAADVQITGAESTDSRVDHAFRKQLLESDEAARQTLVRDYIRAELARIMGIEPAGLEVDQPLSTFGLDSLLALELKNNLEGRLDFTLPMAKLMEGPSIESLATETERLLSASDSEAGTVGLVGDERWEPLLALRPTGTRPPFILLPALGGDVRCYSDLVQHFGDDQPVYAFRPRGVDQELLPHATIDEMIADYLTALRELQPAGPYYLGGWSTGGIFAFALAEALERAGDEVALLGLFDTPLPSICDDVDVEDDARFLCNLINYANRFSGSDIQLSYEELATLEPAERFPTALAEARKRGIIPAETPEAFVRRLVHVGNANVRVLQGYEPQPNSAPTLLFVPRTKGGLAEVSGQLLSAKVDNGWSTEIGQAVELHEVPGDHFTMMLQEGASRLAEELSRRIARPLAAGIGTRRSAT